MKSICSQILLSAILIGCANPDGQINSTELVTDTSDQDTAFVEYDPLFQMHQDIDTLYFDDLNNDGKKDTAVIYSPVHAYPSPDGSSDGGCEDDSCLTQVYFSFTETILEHSNALGFQTFFSTGDLNSDGISEFGFVPNWFQGCWQSLFVYSLDRGKWKKIGSGSVYACSNEDFSQRVSKINNHTFSLISTTWNDAVSMDTTIVIKW